MPVAVDSDSRLELRAYAPAELLALIEGLEAFARRCDVPAAPGVREFLLSGEVSEEFLQKLRTSDAADPWTFGFAVIDRTIPLVIGNAGFHGPPDDDGVVEIGYAVAGEFQGRGYGTEAARKLVEFAQGDPRVRTIRAHTRPEMNPSCQVLIKNGFVRAGSIDDPHDGPVWRWERSRDWNP